jgi:hypothetical protein
VALFCLPVPTKAALPKRTEGRHAKHDAGQHW